MLGEVEPACVSPLMKLRGKKRCSLSLNFIVSGRLGQAPSQDLGSEKPNQSRQAEPWANDWVGITSSHTPASVEATSRIGSTKTLTTYWFNSSVKTTQVKKSIFFLADGIRANNEKGSEGCRIISRKGYWSKKSLKQFFLTVFFNIGDWINSPAVKNTLLPFQRTRV